MKKSKTKKQEKIFDRYKADLEHNYVVGGMVQLIGVGIANNKFNFNSEELLYMNHLLEGLRK